jgi:flagellar biosynthesis protein FlhF
MNSNVQSFRGADAAAALAAARKAVGPDAVVLDTRAVGGGLFRRQEVEVVVAVGPLPAAAPLPARPRTRPVRGAVLAEARPEPGADAPPPPASSADDDVAGELRRLLRELTDARASIAAVAAESRAGRELQLPPAAAETYARLASRGVEPALAEELVRQAMSARPLEALTQAIRDLVE